MKLCSGCGKKVWDTHIVEPCGCMLCVNCYVECVEENDLECVGSYCPVVNDPKNFDKEELYFEFDGQVILDACIKRGYSLGMKEDVLEIIKNEKFIPQFIEMVRGTESKKYKKFRDMNIKEDTIELLEELGITI